MKLAILLLAIQLALCSAEYRRRIMNPMQQQGGVSLESLEEMEKQQKFLSPNIMKEYEIESGVSFPESLEYENINFPKRSVEGGSNIFKGKLQGISEEVSSPESIESEEMFPQQGQRRPVGTTSRSNILGKQLRGVSLKSEGSVESAEQENIRGRFMPRSKRYSSGIKQYGCVGYGPCGSEKQQFDTSVESMEQDQMITKQVESLMGLDRLGKHINERGRTPLGLTKRKPLTVVYGLSYLCGIIDLKTNVLTSRVLQGISLMDKRVSWNPSNYGGITKYEIKHFQTFTPDIMLYNSMEKDMKKHTNKIVSSNGLIQWYPLTTFKSVCDKSKTQQELFHCKLLIGSWTHDSTKLNLRSEGFKVHREGFEGCPTKVINQRAKVVTKEYENKLYDVFEAEFDLVLTKKPLV